MMKWVRAFWEPVGLELAIIEIIGPRDVAGIIEAPAHGRRLATAEEEP